MSALSSRLCHLPVWTRPTHAICFQRAVKPYIHRTRSRSAPSGQLAAPGLANDPHGYRQEFVELVRKAQALAAPAAEAEE